MKCILYTNKLSIKRIVGAHKLKQVQSVHKCCNQYNHYYNELNQHIQVNHETHHQQPQQQYQHSLEQQLQQLHHQQQQ